MNEVETWRGMRMRAIEALLARTERYGPISDAVFRVLFSFIFIVGGFGHFSHRRDVGPHDNRLGRMSRHVNDPIVLLWLSGTFVIGGVCLALGIMTRLSSLLLFAALIPITISIHVAPGHVGPLLKNVAILGGLIHFLVRGPGAYALQPDWRAASA
jgi:putative oxidoreductase